MMLHKWGVKSPKSICCFFRCAWPGGNAFYTWNIFLLRLSACLNKSSKIELEDIPSAFCCYCERLVSYCCRTSSSPIHLRITKTIAMPLLDIVYMLVTGGVEVLGCNATSLSYRKEVSMHLSNIALRRLDQLLVAWYVASSWVYVRGRRRRWRIDRMSECIYGTYGS